jgi:hypothetical protein
MDNRFKDLKTDFEIRGVIILKLLTDLSTTTSLFSSIAGVCATLVGLVFVTYVFKKENAKSTLEVRRNQTSKSQKESFIQFTPFFNLTMPLIMSLVMLLIASMNIIPEKRFILFLSIGLLVLLLITNLYYLKYCLRYYTSTLSILIVEIG